MNLNDSENPLDSSKIINQLCKNKKLEDEYKLKIRLAYKEIDELKHTLRVIEGEFKHVEMEKQKVGEYQDQIK